MSHRRTLLANDTQARKENHMPRLGRQQAPKATTSQFATLLLLPPSIQPDTIEGHRTDHLLQMHRWFSSTAGLSASHPTHRLRNTGFDPTAQGILALRGFIVGLRAVLRQELRALL